MQNLLPIVSTDICEPLRMQIKLDDRLFFEEEIEKIKSENPAVAAFIQEFTRRKDDFYASGICGVIVYKMLRNQAEADQMTREIKLAP